MNPFRSVMRIFERSSGLMLNPPEIVVIEPTNRCNLNCIMCYRHDYVSQTGDMDLDLFKQIVRYIKKTRHICCHGGGEPLLHPAIFEMIDYAYTICHPEILSITTNGTLLNGAIAHRLASSKLTTLYVSIDGADKETYENIRGTSFEKVVENVRYFKSISKIPTVIQFTLMRNNLQSLSSLPQLVSYMGAEIINVQHLLIWNSQIMGTRLADLEEEFLTIRSHVMMQSQRFRIECTIPPVPLSAGRCDLPLRELYFNYKGELAPCCVAIHLSLEKNFCNTNGIHIRHWRRKVARGDFFDECKQFCYVKAA